MVIPCEECLKYAICKSKLKIVCDDLNWFFDETHFEMKQLQIERVAKEGLQIGQSYLNRSGFDQNQTWHQTWDVIREYFPNIKGVYREHPLSTGKIDERVRVRRTNANTL